MGAYVAPDWHDTCCDASGGGNQLAAASCRPAEWSKILRTRVAVRECGMALS
jgi:hypothetical protein